MVKHLAIEVISAYLIFSLCTPRAVNSENGIESSHNSMNINMPDVTPLAHDSYLCTAKKLSSAESYIVQYEPDVNGRRAHHMLLFGCKGLHSKTHEYPGYWNCGGDLCVQMTIMYGWAKNAPTMKLPPKVGFLVGGNSTIQFLVLQIHYAGALPKGVTDNSGLKLQMTTERQPYVTGIHLLLADTARIPPHRPKYHVDVNCRFKGNSPLQVFAYRVHTHSLGTVVSGYSFNLQNNSWSFLSKGNPQWPQAFYPMHQVQTVTNNDILAARCTYNSSRMTRVVQIGSSSHDEMCNLYLMYYTEYQNKMPDQLSPCVGVEFVDLAQKLPPGNDRPLPSDPVLEHCAHASGGHLNTITYNDVQDIAFPNHSFENTIDGTGDHLKEVCEESVFHPEHVSAENQQPMSNHFKYSAVPEWPSSDLRFGQISAVTTDIKGNIVVFHRGNHVWNSLTFDYYNKYLLATKGPIRTSTVLTIDSVSGLLLDHWGSNLFYMPHGLHIDSNGDYWVTDVALHQVFCFLGTDRSKPHLTLGEKFVPGNDREHFCKPASVAISKNGDIYVADGYCNSRIVRFSSTGKFLNQWGKEYNNFDSDPPVGTFRIPHKVVLLEDRNLVCVADRENGRIQCFVMKTGSFRFQIQNDGFGGTVYSTAYSESKGLLFAMPGEAIYKSHVVQVFVYNITDQKLLNVFSPSTGNITRPHDIAASHDGEEVYVCEIGPNVVWKFLREYHKSTKKVLDVRMPETLPTLPTPIHGGQISSVINSQKNSAEGSVSDLQEDATRFETSMVILSLLGIPVLLLILITVIIRLKKRGKLQGFSFGHLKGWLGGYQTPCPQKFNLGTFLNPHKGFDRVAIEESDGDEGSESDIEVFNTSTKKA